MYIVQFLYILALSVMFTATYTADGFTINALPNLLYIAILVIVEILAIFAIIRQWALLIIPFIIVTVRFYCPKLLKMTINVKLIELFLFCVC